MANDNKHEPLVNERTRLLTTNSSSDESHDEDFDGSCSSSLIDSSSPPSVYGTSAQPDEEQCDQDTTTSESGPRTYSNRFISRVVLALLVGELRTSIIKSLNNLLTSSSQGCSQGVQMAHW